MIKSIKINNFKILYWDVNLDFKIDKRTHSKENDFSYFDVLWDKLTKVLAIYWPNASWKTTILEVIYLVAAYLSWDIDKLRKIRIWSNVFHKNEDIEFDIEFYVWNILYKYNLKINPNNFSIFYERLRKVEDKKHYIIFTRKNNTISIPIFTKKEENKILEKINFSSNLSVNTPLSIFLKDCDIVTNYFKKLNLIKPLNIFQAPMIDHMLLPRLYEDLSSENKQRILDSFKEADFSIENIEIKKELIPWWESFQIFIIHNVNWKKFKFPIVDESYWTAQFLAYLSYFFYLKEKGGGVILIDEFDSSLHPLLLNNLLKFFISDYNDNIQIIFNTHDISILYEKALFKDQIWFIDKDPENIEHKIFYKLSDFWKELRDEYDWLKMYMLGELWATPILLN